MDNLKFTVHWFTNSKDGTLVAHTLDGTFDEAEAKIKTAELKDRGEAACYREARPFGRIFDLPSVAGLEHLNVS